MPPQMCNLRLNQPNAPAAAPKKCCRVLYCTILYTLLHSSAQKLLLSRSIYFAIHSNNDFMGFITVNYLEFRIRGEQRWMWREMRIFADKQTIKQTINEFKS